VARDPRAPAGFTLVEILITVALLGGVMTVMLGAVTASTRISDTSVRQSQAEAAARRIAEYMRGGFPMAACGSTSRSAAYETKAQSAAPAGYTVTLTDFAWGTAYAGDNPTWRTDACPDATTPRFERMTLRVVATSDGTTSATVVVVKRDLTKG
jgi:prepilin-type N-terminal cleavage/methylation domain-containing protein